MSTRILRGAAVEYETGESRSTRYNRIGEGLFPKPVRLGPRSVGWPEEEVRALNAARIAGKTNDEIRALVHKLHAARKGAL
jgi:prophage regulatory protein